MFYILQGHSFLHEIQTVAQIFYPNEGFHPVDSPAAAGLTVESRLIPAPETGEAAAARCVSRLYENGTLMAENDIRTTTTSSIPPRKQAARGLYDLLAGYMHTRPPWGMLTGIRPSKLIHQAWDEGRTDAQAVAFLENVYDVQPEKAQLCLSVAKAERHILNTADPDSLSLYIGIPFCPTRCLYCSFTSYPYAKYQKLGLVDAYLEALGRELAFVAEKLDGRPIQTIYIGGGTPTSLDEKQLESLLRRIDALLPRPRDEYTVECGRPDTLNNLKLSLLRAHGVTRISINPQTMWDATLQVIGRAHTVADFENAIAMARATGHDNINVDLILGLPEETAADVSHTIRAVLAFTPENVTVHTLAVKRASRLREELAAHGLAGLTQAAQLERMLDVVRTETAAAGLSPYYMYRQKNMVGNFENVGYTQPGRECIYNIQIMEERQSIWACGAGAATKVVNRNTNHIYRIFNVKQAEHYIARIDEMIQRKRDGLK